MRPRWLGGAFGGIVRGWRSEVFVPDEVKRVPDGYVCDYVDGTFRRDTPEEYIRQIVEKRLINEHGYVPARICVEFNLKMGSGRRAADIVVFPEDGPRTQDHVWLIVECKKEEVEPGNRKDGVEQLKSYMSACPNCEWGMWTNGKYKEVLRKVKVEGRYGYKDYNDIPSADGAIEDIDRPRRNKLKKASDDNLLVVFRTCHNHIYVTDGLQKQAAFFELLKVIFCKTLDEQNVGRALEFYATSDERSNRDGQLTVKNRIGKIYDGVKRKFPRIFDANDVIGLEPRSLAWIVSELQSYTLLDSHVDVKGKAYEELVGANLRGDRGEFFTPRNIMQMAVAMVNPKVDEKVCDTSCGTGGFLVAAMNYVIGRLKAAAAKDFERPESEWSREEQSAVRDRVREIAAANFYGFDINPDLVKATKMNMFMNNDGSGNIFRNDSLLPPHEWSPDTKRDLAKALGSAAAAMTSHKAIEFFDVIVTNPPFGSKIPIKDEGILSQYALGRIWRMRAAPDGGAEEWAPSDKFQKSVPPEQLFVERCLQFLKPGGRLAIVLPDSLLNNPGLQYLRVWMAGGAKIVASVDLHADTFQPRNGTQTSVLILQKKTAEEIQRDNARRGGASHNVFMAMINKVGHDKRGNTLFKRDAEGHEIWVEDDARGGEVRGRSRVIDDETRAVPAIFAEWKRREGVPW